MTQRITFVTCRSVVATAAALCGLTGAQAQSVVANFGGLSLTNITALNGFGLAPPDTNGAIGINHFVQFINGGYAVYNRNGSLAAPATTDAAFWTAAGVSSTLLGEGLSDPRLQFDAASGRWFAAQITLGNASSTNNSVLVAVSNNANPLSGWKSTSYSVAGTTKFNDYPTLGVDANAIYIGSNDFTGAGAYAGNTLSSIPKSSLLAAVPTTAGRATFMQGTTGAFGATPQALTNYGTGYTGTKIIGNSNTVDFGKLQVTSVNNTGAAGATLGATTVVNMAFDGQATLARQPDGSRTVDTLDNRFSGTIYQVGNKIYAANAINLTNQTFSQTAAGNTVGEVKTIWAVHPASSLLPPLSSASCTTGSRAASTSSTVDSASTTSTGPKSRSMGMIIPNSSEKASSSIAISSSTCEARSVDVISSSG